MRRWALALAAFGAAGCGTKDTSFPMWQDGILVEGDCQDDYEIVDGTPTDPVQLYPNPQNPADPMSTDPLWHMDDMPNNLGVVLFDQAAQEELWFNTMNFNPYPIVDFTTQQSVQIWARNPDGCGLTIDEFHVNTTADLSVVLDVTFFDSTLNCGTTCAEDSKAIVMVGIDKTLNAKMCRRVRPGCEPDVTAR